MKLKEFEALKILEENHINIPKYHIFSKDNLFNVDEIEGKKFIVKAQTLNKKRAKAGLVKSCTKDKLIECAEEIFSRSINGEKVNEVLVEEFIEHDQEYYLGFIFDSKSRSPILILSRTGGINVESANLENKYGTVKAEINILKGISLEQAESYVKKVGLENKTKIADFIISAYNCFCSSDATLLEINPFVISKENEIIALDCNINLDDAALSRHTFNFPERIGMKEVSDREKAAREIDRDDYRGTAGKTYMDLEGDIAILASGGGASLTAMDALISYNGKPANYTEYSGNPSSEKVAKLTKITLSKDNLSGCFVIGGTANFTDIYETLKGFMEGLKSIKPKPDYPIVIRRAGPRDKEAYEMLKKFAKEEGFDIHLFDDNTSITYPAKIMVELSNKYKEKKCQS